MEAKINYSEVSGSTYSLLLHHKCLIEISPESDRVSFKSASKNTEYPDMFVIDMLGGGLVWVNENFPKEKYTWYLWFESVFLVPAEMHSILRLKYT